MIQRLNENFYDIKHGFFTSVQERDSQLLGTTVEKMFQLIRHVNLILKEETYSIEASYSYQNRIVDISQDLWALSKKIAKAVTIFEKIDKKNKLLDIAQNPHKHGRLINCNGDHVSRVINLATKKNARNYLELQCLMNDVDVKDLLKKTENKPIEKGKKPVFQKEYLTNEEEALVKNKFAEIINNMQFFQKAETLLPRLNALLSQLCQIKNLNGRIGLIRSHALSIYFTEYTNIRNAKIINSLYQFEPYQPNCWAIFHEKEENYKREEIKGGDISVVVAQNAIEFVNTYLLSQFNFGYVPSNNNSFFQAIVMQVGLESNIEGQQEFRDVLADKRINEYFLGERSLNINKTALATDILNGCSSIESDCRYVVEIYKRPIVIYLNKFSQKLASYGENQPGESINLFFDGKGQWDYLERKWTLSDSFSGLSKKMGHLFYGAVTLPIFLTKIISQFIIYAWTD